MKLSAPKKIVFWVALVLAVIALLATLVGFDVPLLGAFWTAMVAFVLLALGNILKGF